MLKKISVKDIGEHGTQTFIIHAQNVVWRFNKQV